MALRDSDPAEVGGYRIEDRLGAGGMGVVYLARSASGRRLAIKVVHGQYADDDEFRARFRREVAAARQVSGAFTAPVVDADADAPRPWMATLYIPGADLGTHIRRHGPLPPPRLRELAAGLAEALRDIHRAGVVHRDLKPANVMLADDGPRVIDFGISRAAEFAAADVLTQTGRVMGTPPFMSPEQFASPQEVGPAADVFSLGSVLAYAATRRGPFDSPSPYETALRVVEGEPDLSGVPDELLPLLRLCLEKHPKSRVTADELLTLLGDGHTPAPPPAPDGPGTDPARPGVPAPSGRSASEGLGADPARPGAPTQSGRPASRGTDPVRRGTPATRSGDMAPEPTRPSGGRRRRYLLAAAVMAALTAVLAATTVVLTDALSRDSDSAPAPAPPAARSDLPEGWKPWATSAKAPEGSERVLGGSDSPLAGCAAVDTSLVCAGAYLAATRFGLADGRNTWSMPVDPTPDESFGDEGAIIGTGDGRVYAYEADERDAANGIWSSYRVLALAPGSGKVLWRTPTGSGFMATAPDSAQGASTAVPEGVVTFYGPQGDEYALLDAETGEARWKRPKPDGRGDCLLRTAADRAYLVCATSPEDRKAARTTVSQLDPATGKARWEVEIKGAADVLGQHDGRLVLADAFTTGGGLTLIDVSSHVLTVRRLAQPRPEDANVYLVRGTLYFTRSSGGVRAVSPRTGRTLWESNSTVEQQGPPAASATHVYFASPSGRLAALDAGTGKVEDTWPGRDDGGRVDSALVTSGAPPVLVGDALYVPYGVRSVYTVDVRDL
ncbi:serine/threonine protein kinase [Streptomyces viridochromogenes DSM 40736]|uniref:non-specific serine/threonine protein kinase n=1 Tax=Streptomyces viridochromogenes (strain DSM 40736 / JCM 4977 / BCRC 1201 / Tue 494) TaxID=591159 RepID=D9X9C3_STRVT|nr:protein kinase [Streptomyces viridochromogenes]EFL32124.1 serine/threonine protein kinase [Streptomyces viridochromogenes DSM 40736]